MLFNRAGRVLKDSTHFVYAEMTLPSVRELPNLGKLEALHLSGNPLMEWPTPIHRCGNLKHLDLSRCRISELYDDDDDNDDDDDDDNDDDDDDDDGDDDADYDYDYYDGDGDGDDDDDYYGDDDD
ncbi:aspartic acid-rich protein-like [Bolinopsis microptera]|uniref:aspartic acid-rich protein-like n=1 Tax=Bolinopsis microptera TaxID=2820187 RepID=UPI00307A2AF7